MVRWNYKRVILYGNPYTGFVSNDREPVERSLGKDSPPWVAPPYTVVSRVHKGDIIYWWLSGKRKENLQKSKEVLSGLYD
jgi:hypothetical protein